MSILLEAYELHNVLNPKIWNEDNTMKDDVLEKLNEISQEFIKYIDIPLSIVDVNVVGSNASYNYNNQSDIDLHIIVNNELTYMDETILQQLYNAKKNSFNNNYDLNIKGIPVELYIEDVLSGNATKGRYSIYNKKWLQEPKYLQYDLPDISKELDKYIDKSNEILNSNIPEEVQNFLNDLYMKRKISLAEEGELSVGNLIFKELRNLGILEELKNKYYELQSDKLSL